MACPMGREGQCTSSRLPSLEVMGLWVPRCPLVLAWRLRKSIEKRRIVPLRFMGMERVIRDRCLSRLIWSVRLFMLFVARRGVLSCTCYSSSNLSNQHLHPSHRPSYGTYRLSSCVKTIGTGWGHPRRAARPIPSTIPVETKFRGYRWVCFSGCCLICAFFAVFSLAFLHSSSFLFRTLFLVIDFIILIVFSLPFDIPFPSPLHTHPTPYRQYPLVFIFIPPPLPLFVSFPLLPSPPILPPKKKSSTS